MDVLSTVYFPTAVALGALHALEPGHAKALTAAYLIGIKGTKRDSVLLGLAVAATHSCVVIGISAFALWLGREAFAGEATRWLEIASGGVAISIGVWMLQRRIRQRRRGAAGEHAHHRHQPTPQPIDGKILRGTIEIIDTPAGERMRFASAVAMNQKKLQVCIKRSSGQMEILDLVQSSMASEVFMSTAAPAEPHEFSAFIKCETTAESDTVNFEMHEPEHDHHDHDKMTDDEHAREHAATLPDYVQEGARPSSWQILVFGAAGGMIPCPASIMVMLLALSVGKTANGLFAVLGFSLGLAATLVGVGLLVVTGLSRIATNTGRVAWFAKHAPIASAGLVILSGVFALGVALQGGGH